MITAQRIPAEFRRIRPGRLACQEFADVVTQAEAELGRKAPDMCAVFDAAADAGQMCHGCPCRETCLATAQVSRYSGIAGGKVLIEGQVIA